MKTLLNWTTIGIVALIFPMAAWAANVSGTQTLNSGQTFAFDTGTAASSGGDILLGSSGITLQGTATAGGSAALSGMSTYNSLVGLGASGASNFSSFLSASPIPTSSLNCERHFRGTKLLAQWFGIFIITASGGSSITFQFTTFVTAASTAPTITQVINNYSLIPAGFTNSGIAQGALFIVKGSNLRARPRSRRLIRAPLPACPPLSTAPR